MPPPRAVIFGCEGLQLSGGERSLFRDVDPFGLILFRRNCSAPEQIAALVADFRDCVGRPDAPVLIDQEGGRVARLAPPTWPRLPPARGFGELAERDAEAGHRAAWIGGRLMASLLSPLGITVNCAPVCDVPVEGAHDIIGDRAFANDPALVTSLAETMSQGMLAGGVIPTIKHIPGHGRALADSHKELPVVTASTAELQALDFQPFRTLRALPAAMVAHIRYEALDPERPASISTKVIGDVIRKEIGFDGLLVSDDLDMKALSGTPAARAAATINAGCDLVLQCNGDLATMSSVAFAVPAMTDRAIERWERARAMVTMVENQEPAVLSRTLAALMPSFTGQATDHG